jgi:archaellum biogenesis protein FlaJ (TadC family)
LILIYFFIKKKKVSRTEINLEYQAIESELKKLETELKHYSLGDIEDTDIDQFAPIMHRFYNDASAQFKRICMLFTKMDESYDSAVRFYGEDPKKIQPDEFFEIFARFTASWEVNKLWDDFWVLYNQVFTFYHYLKKKRNARKIQRKLD